MFFQAAYKVGVWHHGESGDVLVYVSHWLIDKSNFTRMWSAEPGGLLERVP